MTDLERIALRVILAHPGGIDFEHIFEEVLKCLPFETLDRLGPELEGLVQEGRIERKLEGVFTRYYSTKDGGARDEWDERVPLTLS